MEVAMLEQTSELTLGPVLFNWKPERWRDFYFRIADEAPVTTVYLGEAICFKRAPLFDEHYGVVVERLVTSGKKVVHSTLSEVMSKQERCLVAEVCSDPAIMVEANDGSALSHLRGRPHHVGPFMNVYNERTMTVLARGGAYVICLPSELPADAIAALCVDAPKLGVAVETQVFGRLSLALSARCYHARAHDRNKDSCQFSCNEDPDGMPLRTLDNQPFLAINGIQTMSHDYLNLIGELADLEANGVRRFRLSPHSCDMVEVATTFRDVLDRRIDAREAAARLGALKIEAPFSNGFYHGKAGHLWN
jgi:O2-independent ubiquinone biosynthesis protein UbiV